MAEWVWRYRGARYTLDLMDADAAARYRGAVDALRAAVDARVRTEDAADSAAFIAGFCARLRGFLTRCWVRAAGSG